MPRKKQSTSAANPALKNQAKEESAPAEEASIISAPALQPPSTPSRAVKKNESQKESESQNEEKSNDIKFSTPHADKRSKAPSFSNEKKSASRRGRGQAGDEQDTTRSRLDLTSTPSKEKPSSAAATTVETGVSLSTSASPRSNYAKLAVDGRVEDVYRILRLTTGQLGGNGYSGAIYGELTMRSMQRVLNIMTKKCGLNADSRFIDVGAGLGKPNFHAAQDPAVRLSIGIELEDIRWKVVVLISHLN